PAAPILSANQAEPFVSGLRAPRAAAVPAPRVRRPGGGSANLVESECSLAVIDREHPTGSGRFQDRTRRVAMDRADEPRGRPTAWPFTRRFELSVQGNIRL